MDQDEARLDGYQNTREKSYWAQHQASGPLPQSNPPMPQWAELKRTAEELTVLALAKFEFGHDRSANC